MSSAVDIVGDTLGSIGDIFSEDMIGGLLGGGILGGQLMGAKEERDLLSDFEKRQQAEQDAIQKREKQLRQSQSRAAISDRNDSLFDLLGSSQEGG